MSDKKEMKEIVADLADAVNVMGNRDKNSIDFSEALQSKHRTLQQSAWDVIFQAIQHYGANARFDPRNQASVDACKALSKVLDNIYLPLI